MRLPYAVVIVAAVSLMPLAAQAQIGFQIDRYTTPMLPSDLFWTERANTPRHLQLSAVLAVGYQRNPLTVRRADGSIASAVIADDLRAHAAITLGLFDRVQLGLAVPIVLLSTGATQQTTINPSPTGTALGDMRADVRVRLLGSNAGGGIRLATALAVIAPTGRADAYASDGSFEATARAMLEWEARAGVRLVANGGVALRPETQFAGYVRSSDVFVRLGAEVPLVSNRTVFATFETIAWTQLGAHVTPFARYGFGAEALGGVRYASNSGMFFGLAAGGGLAEGVGTPEARVIAMLGRGYVDPAPRHTAAGDDDHDGVANARDECPLRSMGAHPDPARLGCPSTDDDRDGYVNPLDNCPDEPAGASPDYDRPGCPLRPYVAPPAS